MRRSGDGGRRTYPGFGGRVGRTFAGSEGWWPERPVPPAGAPNDVGIDRRSPVSWPLYEAHGPYPYSGRIGSVSYRPGEPAPDSPASLIDVLREMGAKFE